MNRTQQFWNEQAEWSRATFGSDTERGPLGPLKHLEKEAREAMEEAARLSNTPKNIHRSTYEAIERKLKVEIADCLFLTFDAARRAGMTLEDLLDEAFHKLEINKSRKWGKPTSNEAVEHIRS